MAEQGRLASEDVAAITGRRELKKMNSRRPVIAATLPQLPVESIPNVKDLGTKE
jgi:hypothetical protein